MGKFNRLGSPLPRLVAFELGGFFFPEFVQFQLVPLDLLFEGNLSLGELAAAFEFLDLDQHLLLVIFNEHLGFRLQFLDAGFEIIDLAEIRVHADIAPEIAVTLQRMIEGPTCGDSDIRD